MRQSKKSNQNGYLLFRETEKNDNKEGVTTRSKTRAFIITLFPTF